MDATSIESRDDLVPTSASRGELVYRQSAWTRITHWVWAICLFFLLLTGLQIFNAHPALYIGDQSGFGSTIESWRSGAENTADGPRGYTTVFGQKFDTTGVLGLSGEPAQLEAFPSWATIPSYHDLGDRPRRSTSSSPGCSSGTLLVWLVASLVNGHAWRDLIPKPRDLRNLPRDIVDHAQAEIPPRARLQRAAETRLCGRAVHLCCR